MANVTIIGAGHVERTSDGYDQWTFTAQVDKQVGLITVLFPPGTTERQARDGVTLILELDPNQLEGNTSTGSGSPGEALGTDEGSGDEGDGGDEGQDDGGGDGEGEEDDGEEDGGDDGSEGEETSAGSDEGDGVGEDTGHETKIAIVIAKRLGTVVLPSDETDGDGTGRTHSERLSELMDRVHALGGGPAPLDGLGDDVGGNSRERLIVLVARALASGAIAPAPDDENIDGDGTGRPIPALKRGGH